MNVIPFALLMLSTTTPVLHGHAAAIRYLDIFHDSVKKKKIKLYPPHHSLYFLSLTYLHLIRFTHHLTVSLYLTTLPILPDSLVPHHHQATATATVIAHFLFAREDLCLYVYACSPWVAYTYTCIYQTNACVFTWVEWWGFPVFVR